MPVYARRCTECHHRFEDFRHAAQVRDADLSTLLPCPECKAPSETDFSVTRTSLGYRHFTNAGGVSLTEGCNPKEVRALKRLVGPDLEGCVGIDGQMRFDDSRQRRAWDARMDAIKAKARAKKEKEREHRDERASRRAAMARAD